MIFGGGTNYRFCPDADENHGRRKDEPDPRDLHAGSQGTGPLDVQVRRVEDPDGNPGDRADDVRDGGRQRRDREVRARLRDAPGRRGVDAALEAGQVTFVFRPVFFLTVYRHFEHTGT